MTGVRRDATLAACCVVFSLGFLRATGDLAALADPSAAVAGVAVALAVEGAFLVDGAVADAWERSWVRVGGAASLLLGVAVLTVRVGPAVAAAACWGLLTYFALLALVLSGHWPVEGRTTER